MITYKDKTFCNNEKCSIKCDRRLTEEIIAEANSIGLPISVADFNCEENSDDC